MAGLNEDFYFDLKAQNTDIFYTDISSGLFLFFLLSLYSSEHLCWIPLFVGGVYGALLGSEEPATGYWNERWKKPRTWDLIEMVVGCDQKGDCALRTI